MKVYEEWVNCLPVRGCNKKLRIKTLREIRRLIYENVGMDCFFCHASKGQAQWVIPGHGIAYVCPSCEQLGMIYDVDEVDAE